MKAFQGGVLVVIVLLAMTSGLAAAVKMGTLNVSSIPPGAQILLNGTPMGDTPDSFSLPVGYYSLKLTTSGYQDYTRTVRVRNATTTSVYAIMKPLPVLKVGNLNVSSIPAGTTLYLNGSDRGNVPPGGKLIQDLPVGRYEVKLTKDGYSDFIKVVRVYNGTTTQVRAMMQGFSGVYTGNLNVTSIPSGATLYVNNSSKGLTPQLIAGLPVGDYEVKMTLGGYDDYAGTFAVTSGNTTEVLIVLQALPPQPRVEVGSLDIVSDPDGAFVFLNNSARGNTPLFIADLPAGDYQVKMTNPGYKNFITDITIVDGQTTSLNIFMQAIAPPPTIKTGDINVNSFPQGASVFLNNSNQGVTPVLIPNLPVGDYEVRLTLSGYQDYIKVVKVQDAQTYPIYAFMQSIPPGNLVINSTPPGASIYIIDPYGMGSYPGYTNKTLTNIIPGLYWVQVQQYGFGVNYTNVMVNQGETAVVEFVLPKMCIFPYP